MGVKRKSKPKNETADCGVSFRMKLADYKKMREICGRHNLTFSEFFRILTEQAIIEEELFRQSKQRSKKSGD